MIDGLGLGTGGSRLSRTGSSVLRGRLAASRGAGGLWGMDRTRVVRERLGSIDALLWSLGSITLAWELRPSWGAEGLWVRMGVCVCMRPSRAQHASSTLQHGIHGLSWIGAHGLKNLLLAVLRGIVLQI